MGLISFVKDAGKKLFGRAEAAEAPEEALKKEAEELGLDTSGLDIKMDGETVKITGKPVSQEIKEKLIVAMGNVEGVSAVEDDAEGDDMRTYTVEKGDSLWKISANMLGNGARYNEIFEANRPMLSDPDKIYPGQVLRIPAE